MIDMTQQTIRLSSPGDLLTSVPFVLGFHPKRCVVLACLHGQRLGLVQRIDIPLDRHVEQAVDAMVEPMARENPTSIILIGYEDALGDSTLMLDTLAVRIDHLRIEVDAVLVVRDGRWYSVDCQKSCCPPEGTPLVGRDAITAEFIGQGANPQESRELVASRLEPTGPVAVNVPRMEDPKEITTDVATLWTNAMTMNELGLPEIGILAGSLYCVDFRDALIAHVCPGTLDMDLVSPEIQQILTLLPAPNRMLMDKLIDLCSKLSDADAAPMTTLLGCYAWHEGNGAVALMAVERALRCDPTYRLARLLEMMISTGTRTKKESA